MNEGILHCDLNGFYASVECLFRPELRDVPMAVSGNPDNRHGIILAKNEHAKKFGVATAETIWQAKRKCPQLVLVQPSHGRYGEFSRKVNAIYSRFTNRVEPFGIDESWLDVRAAFKLFGSGAEIADKLRKAVRAELGLTISVGVSFNKIFAKLGSDYKKPDATTLISEEDFREIVFPLPVSNLLFVGRKTGESLSRMGIRTIGELASADGRALVRKFGRHGAFMHEAANGLGGDGVGFYGDEDEAKSVGNSVTYPRDLAGFDELNAAARDLAQTVGARLRKEKLKCCAVHVAIKNPDFKTITRQTTLDNPTNLPSAIAAAAMRIICAEWDFSSPVRMLGISCSNLRDASEPAVQMSVFAEDNKREIRSEKIEDALETLRQKYGDDIVKRL